MATPTSVTGTLVSIHRAGKTVRGNSFYKITLLLDSGTFESWSTAANSDVNLTATNFRPTDARPVRATLTLTRAGRVSAITPSA